MLRSFARTQGSGRSGLVAAKEAVELGREAVAKDPLGVVPELAKSLANYGNIMLGLGHPAEAKDAWAEGAKLLRPLAMRMPDAFGDLFEMLRKQWFHAASETAAKLGVYEGSAAFDEADRLFRALLSRIRRTGHLPVLKGAPLSDRPPTNLSRSFFAEQAGNGTIAPVAAVAELVLTDLAVAAGGEDEGEGSARDGANHADVFLNWRRACARTHPDDATIRSELAREIYSAWDDAKDKGERDRCSDFVSEMRDLSMAYTDDSDVREGLARMLFSSADDAEHGAQFLQELRDLHLAHPEDPEVRIRHAFVLHVEGNRALAEGDHNRRTAAVRELRGLSGLIRTMRLFATRSLGAFC